MSIGGKFAFDDSERLSTVCYRFLDRLIGIIGADSSRIAALEALERQTRSWGDRRCGEPVPSIRSTSVGLPFECSLALDDGKPELRWVSEILGAEPTQASYWNASMAHLRAIADGNRRATEIADALTPLGPSFQMMFGVVCTEGRPPAHKLYLHGWHGAYPFPFPWQDMLALGGASALAERLDRALTKHEQVTIVSLDLDDDDDARAKAYLRFLPHSAQDVFSRHVHDVAASTPQKFEEFRTTMKQGCERLGPVEELSLVSKPSNGGKLEQAAFVIRNIPHDVTSIGDMDPAPGSDLFLANGMHRVLESHGISPAIYDRILDELTSEGLDDSYYFQTCLSYQERAANVARATVYFAPQIYAGRMVEVAHSQSVQLE